MKRGFTLIELLVVIAVVGLLASIILASLGTSRKKAADAAIKTSLLHARSQVELQYSAKGCYTNTSVCSGASPAVISGVCPASASAGIFGVSNVASQITAAKTASGATISNSCAATVGGTKWAIAVVLNTDNSQAWCVDSTAASKLINAPVAGTAYTQANLDSDISGGVCGS